jgi:hypothetical protein
VARRDLVLLAVLLASVVLLAALVGGADRGEAADDPRASTLLTSDGGLQALYWTLEELEVPVARRTAPLVEGPRPRGGLALVAPTVDLSPVEVAVVMERVREGGLLVYVGSPWDRAGGPIYDSLGLATRWIRRRGPHDDRGAAAPSRPHRYTAGVPAVEGFRAAFADSSAALRGGRATVLLAADSGAAAVTFRVGKGRVLALADQQPLTNARLRESGAATLLARAAAASGDTLWFDEYHHGFRDGSVARGTLRRLGSIVPGGAWVHLAVLGALLLLAGARRFGTPLPPPRAERRSPLEHVEALAGAYRQADARHTARRLLVAGLARRLGRRAPPDERAASEMLDRVARGSPAAAAPAAELQREWKRGTAADLAALARAIDRFLEQVRR